MFETKILPFYRVLSIIPLYSPETQKFRVEILRRARLVDVQMPAGQWSPNATRGHA